MNNFEDINKVDSLGRTFLHNAVIIEDKKSIDILIYLNIDLNIRDNDGCTAMHLAVKQGNIEIVEKLIQSGADINLEDNAKWTALTYACDKSYEYIVRLLLSRGIKIDAISLEIAVAAAQNLKELGGIILDYLKHECNRRILECFYRKDLDKLREVIIPLKPLYRLQENEILCIGEATMTTWILEEAHRTNNEELLKILLENGIELDLHRYNVNMLPIVCDYSDVSNVKILLDKNVPIDTFNGKGESCLFIAARNNDVALMKFLLSYDVSGIINIPNEFGVTPLHMACAHANTEMVNKLVEKGANIYHRIKLKIFLDYLDSVEYECIDDIRTKMYELKRINYLNVDSMGLTCCLGYEKIIPILIHEGYRINRPIDSGNTALHIASMMNNVSLMKYLVISGSNVNAVNDFGDTALHIACVNIKSQSVLELIAMGASALIRNKLGRTPLHIAYEKNNNCIVRFLSNKYNMMYVVNQADINKVTLLHLACKRLAVDKVEFLLKMGAKTNVVDINGNSPVHCIFESDVTKQRQERIKQILKMLKEKVIDINLKNVNGYSALDIACMRGKIDDICILIENDAEIGINVLEPLIMKEEGKKILDILNKKKKESGIHIEKIVIQKNIPKIQK